MGRGGGQGWGKEAITSGKMAQTLTRGMVMMRMSEAVTRDMGRMMRERDGRRGKEERQNYVDGERERRLDEGRPRKGRDNNGWAERREMKEKRRRRVEKIKKMECWV